MTEERTMVSPTTTFHAALEPFRAGDWIIDPEVNSLRNGTEERRVEPKVMKVLMVLAGRQNHVVPKDEIMAAVWPETFVGDDVLTRCISVLRRVTHDDAHAPKFIQTIPKVGYRLVAEVSAIVGPDAVAATTDVAEVPAMRDRVPEPERAPIPPEPRTSIASPSRLPVYVFAGVAVLLLVLLGASIFWFRRASADRPEAFRTLTFTSLAGEQWQPAFAPDGKSVVFAAVSGENDSRHLYVKTIGSDAETQVTFGAGEDFSPAWSPDGRQIAYLSRADDQFGLYIVTLGSRDARRVFIPQQPSQWEQGALAWSPDGKTLVFPDHVGSSPNSSLFELDLSTLQAHVITTPPSGWEGDLTPAYSPDGKTIAFTRASETAVRDIYCVSRKDGSVRAITHDHSNIDSIAWMADGKHILFSSNRGGKFALWKTDLSGKDIQRLPVGTEDAVQPAVGAGGKLLAYAQGSSVWSILRVTATSSDTIVSSTQFDSAPSLAGDGERFAFQSQRSGFQEIWTGKLDGSDLRQITHQNGPITGSPSWSHRGDRILFDSRVGGHSHIFTIPAAGGSARQLTTGDANDIVPRWSNDDSVIYFRSNRGGRWQLWRMKLNGEPQPMTTGDGIAPQESPDGTLLFYTRGGEDGLWSVSTGGGAEKQVMDQPLASYWGYWQMTKQGIYYLDRAKDTAAIEIYNPGLNRSSLFAKVPLSTPEFAGLAVSQDGKVALLTQEAHTGRHITLVRNGN